MKKYITLFVLLITIFGCCSCSNLFKLEDKKDVDTGNDENTKTRTEQSEIEQSENVDIEPDLSQIQNICQLATLKCYYHNTAKEIKPAGSGITHIGEEDTPFWFEYTAQATLGIDFSLVSMDIDDEDKITIHIPHATILGNIIVDSTSTTDPIYRPHRFFSNDVEISASDVTASMSNANEEVRNQILADTATLYSAEERAKELIENYIDQIMALSGKDYEINWAYVTEE